MMKPWSCGAIFTALLVLVAAIAIFSSPSHETQNTVLAAHKACEAQTGKPCD